MIEATDPHFVKLIADVAHLALGGADPAEVIRSYRARLMFVHFKDLRADVATLARRNPALVRRKKYLFCELGAGVVGFPAILSALREIRFPGWIIVELDGYERWSGRGRCERPEEQASGTEPGIKRVSLDQYDASLLRAPAAHPGSRKCKQPKLDRVAGQMLQKLGSLYGAIV